MESSPREDNSKITNSLRKSVTSSGYKGQIVHVGDIPPREAEFKDHPSPWRHPSAGPSHLSASKSSHSHQAEAVDLIRDRKHVAIVTSTASGKTLCYTIPVIETLLADPSSTALFMFPTKALAQDQLRALGDLALLLPARTGRCARDL